MYLDSRHWQLYYVVRDSSPITKKYLGNLYSLNVLKISLFIEDIFLLKLKVMAMSLKSLRLIFNELQFTTW